MLLEALNSARDLGRLHEIAAVLLRHGLGDIVARLGIASVLERAGKAVHWAAAERLSPKSTEQRLRETLEELGPTFVKVGQLLAGRTDLLPPHWTAELAQLQEQAASVPFDAIEAQLVEDLGAPLASVFREVEREPIAAASIAQVHGAVLPDGTRVALKVRRPGIEAVVDADLRLLARLADSLERNVPELRRYRPRSLAREFSASLQRELDLAAEARSAERMARNLVGMPGVVIPRIYERWTCRRLCVMDRLDGPSMGDWIREGRTGSDEARRIAGVGADAVLHMVFVDGLYHADPHPGNVMLLEDGRIGLLDFGMVGHLSESRRTEFLELLLGIIERREDDVADILLGWSKDGAVDVSELTRDCAAFIDRYEGVPLARLQATELLSDIASVLRDNDLFLPPDLAMLLKVFVTLDGLGRQLDPDFVMTAHMAPFAEQALATTRSPLRAVRRNTRELARFLQGLPRDLRRLLRAARRGRFQLDIGVTDLEHFGRQLDHSSNRITMGLVTSALIVGTAIALTIPGGPRVIGLPVFALVGFISSVAVGLALLWSIARSGRR